MKNNTFLITILLSINYNYLISGPCCSKQRFYNIPQHGAAQSASCDGGGQAQKAEAERQISNTPSFASSTTDSETYCEAATCNNAKHNHFDFLRYAHAKVVAKARVGL